MSQTTIATGSQHHSALRVEYQATALNEINSTEQTVVDSALDLIARDVEARCIPVERVSIKRHFSPEDESEELVLTVWVRATPEDAIDYWLSLADTISAWAAALAPPYKDVASEHIAVAVRSTVRT